MEKIKNVGVTKKLKVASKKREALKKRAKRKKNNDKKSTNMVKKTAKKLAAKLLKLQVIENNKYLVKKSFFKLKQR